MNKKQRNRIDRGGYMHLYNIIIHFYRTIFLSPSRFPEIVFFFAMTNNSSSHGPNGMSPRPDSIAIYSHTHTYLQTPKRIYQKRYDIYIYIYKKKNSMVSKNIIPASRLHG